MHQPKQGEVAAHKKERQELGTECQNTTVQRERIWKDGPLFIILFSLPPFLLAGTEPQTIFRRHTTVSKLTKASRTVPLWELCWGHQLVSIQAVDFLGGKRKGEKVKAGIFWLDFCLDKCANISTWHSRSRCAAQSSSNCSTQGHAQIGRIVAGWNARHEIRMKITSSHLNLLSYAPYVHTCTTLSKHGPRSSCLGSTHFFSKTMPIKECPQCRGSFWRINQIAFRAHLKRERERKVGARIRVNTTCTSRGPNQVSEL